MGRTYASEDERGRHFGSSLERAGKERNGTLVLVYGPHRSNQSHGSASADICM